MPSPDLHRPLCRSGNACRGAAEWGASATTPDPAAPPACARRVALLPRVCQRWHQLLGTPGTAWAEVEWTATLTTPASVTRCHAFLRWLAPRCGLLRRLSFVVERTHADVWLTRAAVATLQLILRSAAASLAYLKLVLPCPVELELWLQAPTPALEALLVGAHSVSVGPSTAERMRSLRHLELFTPEDEGPPTFEPGARLPPGLTRLVLVPGRPRLPECVLELQHLGYLDIGGEPVIAAGRVMSTPLQLAPVPELPGTLEVISSVIW